MIMVFTDGSCNKNTRGIPNIGGYAYVLLNEHGNKISEFVGKEINTTNNRMELMAVISCLEFLNDKKDEIFIFSDSQYVVNAINQKWINSWKKHDFKKGKFKKPIPNDDLWNRMYNLLENKTNIHFKWVRGHTKDNTWNNHVDKLASTVYKPNFSVINKS